MDVTQLTAAQLKSAQETGELTAVEICEAFLDRIDAQEEAIGAFVQVDRGGVLQMAETVDHRRELGEGSLGPLAGIPLAVKDNICATGGPTTCASTMLAEYFSPYDATVVTRLKAADACLIGKTNLDEFAMGGSTENSGVRPTKNPWDTTRVPGGSSGGSAASVAARMVPASLGSDTGGSIRQPASFCGVVGLKPTYGRVSRYGLVAFASSLDQIGPLGRTVEDVALVLDAISGHDERDSTSAPHGATDCFPTVTQPLEGLRLGIVPEHFEQGLDPEVEAAVREAIRVYEGLGAQVVDIALPHSQYGIATYYIIAPCEASGNLARYDGAHYGRRAAEEVWAARMPAEERTGQDASSPLVQMYCHSRSEGLGAEVKRRIMLGTYALSAGYYDAYYLKALQVRRLIKGDYDEAFRQVDFIVGPVAPTPAFKIGDKSNDPLAMYLGDMYTVSANLAGVAGLSLPCGLSSNGLPIGLQLQARAFDEARLLRAGHMFQTATDWHLRSPA